MASKSKVCATNSLGLDAQCLAGEDLGTVIITHCRKRR